MFPENPLESAPVGYLLDFIKGYQIFNGIGLSGIYTHREIRLLHEDGNTVSI